MNDLNPYKNLKSIKDDSDLCSKIITAPIIAISKAISGTIHSKIVIIKTNDD